MNHSSMKYITLCIGAFWYYINNYYNYQFYDQIPSMDFHTGQLIELHQVVDLNKYLILLVKLKLKFLL